jgi:hypothetical protein
MQPNRLTVFWAELFMTVVQNLSDLDGSNGLKIIGKANSERIGAFISVRGHFDNDGLDDLAFGGFFVGRGTLVLGSSINGSSAIDLNDRSSFVGAEFVNIVPDPFNLWVSSGFIGDINNDGIDDLSFAAFGEINHVVGPGDQISREPENGFLFEDGGVTAFIFGTAALKEIARYQVYPAAKE